MTRGYGHEEVRQYVWVCETCSALVADPDQHDHYHDVEAGNVPAYPSASPDNVPCGHCRGTGGGPDAALACSVCGGSGMVADFGSADDAETDVRQNDLVRLERVMDLLRQAGWGHLSREEVNAVLNAADEIVARGRVTEATDARMDTGSESGAEGEGPQPPKHEATLPSVVDVSADRRLLTDDLARRWRSLYDFSDMRDFDAELEDMAADTIGWLKIRLGVSSQPSAGDA